MAGDAKRCTTCRALLPVTSFSPCRNGLQSSCRACRNALSRQLANTPCVESQTCSACKTTKGAGEFNRSRRNKSGLQAECKACTRARKRRVQYAVTLNEKYCPDCARTLPAHEFPRDKKRVGGLRGECRECSAIKNAASIYKIPVELARELRNRSHCDLCGAEYKNSLDVNIDHCHASGSVRGAICTCCNLMLGGARDCPEILMQAVRYLRGAGTWRRRLEVIRA